MGLFPRFGPEGPDAPRKTGRPRLWELAGRYVWNDLRAGFLALIGCLPFAAGLIFSCGAHSLAAAPVLGLIGGAVAGPELCCLADTILRGLRDEQGPWWRAYRKAWARSARAALLPGALGGGLLSTQVFVLVHAQALQVDAVAGTALVLGMLLLLGLSLYLWPQMALMDLSLGQLIKNSVLLFIGQLPRSAAAVALLTAYIVISLRSFAVALSLLPVTNLWLPVLPALLLIYPGLDEAFGIGEESRADREPPEDG